MCLYLQKFSWTSSPAQGMNPDNLTELCPAQSCWGIPINLLRCAPYLYHILHIAPGTESIASQFPKKIHFSNCISPGSTLKNYTHLLILHESTLLRQCNIDLYTEGLYVFKSKSSLRSALQEPVHWAGSVPWGQLHPWQRVKSQMCFLLEGERVRGQQLARQLHSIWDQILDI